MIEQLIELRRQHPEWTVTRIAGRIGCSRQQLSHHLNHNQEFTYARLVDGLALFLSTQRPKHSRIGRWFRRERWQ